MACEILPIGSIGDCAANEGGVTEALACKLSDITSVTITSGVVSNFTMATTGKWKPLVADIDATANYKQTGSLNNNRKSIEQASFLKFKGISNSQTTAADAAFDCCDVVVIYFLANNEKLVQGFEKLAATGAPERTKNRSTRITPTIDTDVSTNESRTEYVVSGNSNTFSMHTSLTKAALLAL